MIKLRAVLIILVLMLPATCRTPPPLMLPSLPIYAWPSDGLDGIPPSRVAVLPFGEDVGYAIEADRIRDAVIGALRTKARFDVVVIHHEDIRHLPTARFDGSVESTSYFLELANSFAVDGVIRGDLTQLQPYREPSLGLRLELWSLREGTRLWRAEGVLDTADEGVLAHLQHYRDGQRLIHGEASDVEDVRRSLSRLYEFAAESLIRRL